MSIGDRLKAIDRFQQRHRRLSFVAAVLKKAQEDQAAQLAALLAYYAFVSIFPLLLVLVTVLGFVLHSHPEDQRKLLEGALGQFPILANQLHGLHALTGSTPALVIGVILALLSGLGITSATQNAFNTVWAVPRNRRPSFVVARLRGLAVLASLGALNLISTAAAGFVGAGSHSLGLVIAGIVLAFALDVGLFAAAFRLLTALDLGWRELWPGVVLAAVFWEALQHLGGFYIAHELKHTEALYGFFALVLGLLAWLYLGAQLTILAAEVNVVHTRKLWPRSFFSPPLLEADKRSLVSLAEVEERVEGEDIDVTFSTPE